MKIKTYIDPRTFTEKLNVGVNPLSEHPFKIPVDPDKKQSDEHIFVLNLFAYFDDQQNGGHFTRPMGTAFVPQKTIWEMDIPEHLKRMFPKKQIIPIPFSVAAFVSFHGVTVADVKKLLLASHELTCMAWHNIDGQSIFDQYRNEIFTQIDLCLSAKRRKKPANTGFDASLTKDQLETLYLGLKKSYIHNLGLKKSYIHTQTDFDNFCAAFSPDPLPNKFEKIIWLRDATELTYLIATVLHGYIHETTIWKTTNRVFIDEHGQTFNNLKQSRSQSKAIYPDLDAIGKRL